MGASDYSSNPSYCHDGERNDESNNPELQPDFSAHEMQFNLTSGDSSFTHLKLPLVWSSVQDFVVEHMSSKDLDLDVNKEVLESNGLQYVGWNDLRDVVLYSLHAFFKTAVEMISHEGYAEDAVIQAIVDSALCYHFDGPLTKIADSARILLQSGKLVGSVSSWNLDTDLHMLGLYILSCASSTLKKQFSFFTWDDALWCILLCDMDLSIAHEFAYDLNAYSSERSESLAQNLNELSRFCGYSARESPGKPALSRSLEAQRTWFNTLTGYIVSAQKSAGKGQVALSGQNKVDSFGQVQKASSLPRTADRNNIKSAKGVSSKRSPIKSQESSSKDYDFFESFQPVKGYGKTSSRKLKESKSVISFLESARSTMAGTSNTKGLNSSTLVSTLPLSNLPSANRSDSPTVVSTPPPFNGWSGPKQQMIPDVFIHFSLPKTPADGFEFYFSLHGMQTTWIPKDRKEELALDLIRRLGELKLDVKVWIDWANGRVMQSTSRLSVERTILASLRQGMEEAEDCGVFNRKKLEETERAVDNTAHELDWANSRVLVLTDVNLCYRLEKEAVKLQEKQSDASFANILSKKNESLEKLKSVETEKVLLQKELVAESSELSMLQKNLEQAKGYEADLKKRCQEEEEMADEAMQQVSFERNELERIETLARMEFNLHLLNVQNEHQRLQADVKLLEQQVDETLEFLHQQRELSSNSNPRSIGEITNPAGAGFDSMCREQECVMCMQEVISVVFLPCGHQIVCEACSQLHQDQGMTDCPSCRSPINRRICARFAES